MEHILLLFALHAFVIRPDLALTPGVLNPVVTELTLSQTICKVGWTKTVRPPVTYTSQLKRRQIVERRLPGSAKDYEEDHLIPLELGGHPTDPLNLWPEPWTGMCNARDKDKLENELHGRVCHRMMRLEVAQLAIQTDWIAAYRRYVGGLVCP